MPQFLLEGGTDVAEMVLFSGDNLGTEQSVDETLEELSANSEAIRLPTGADGAYLLRLFINEELPSEVLNYCNTEDVIEAAFRCESGKLSFGGAESVYSSFKHNTNIRSDVNVIPGVFDAVAYQTDYPEEVIEDAITAAIGKDGEKILSRASTIAIYTIVLALLFLFITASLSKWALIPLILSLIGGIFWYKVHVHSDLYKETAKKSEAAQLDFPSIVIRLTSKAPPEN